MVIITRRNTARIRLPGVSIPQLLRCCIKNLENDTPKKQAKPKRTAPKKKDVTKVKKTEIKIEKTEETKPIEEKKEEKKNKLPSWLL